MARYAVLHRYPVGDGLEGLVDWFWAVSWHLPDGQTHVQQVLNHPSGHISIGTLDDVGADPDHPGRRVYGLITRVSQRRLTGTGWTVAAKTTTGGLGALLGRPARTITDRRSPSTTPSGWTTPRSWRRSWPSRPRRSGSTG